MARASVAEARTWAARYLDYRGVSDASREAQALLAFTLGWSRSRILAHGNDRLKRSESAMYEALIVRRGRREPYAYVVGSKEWLDFSLAVDRNVLIPRPETETLAESAIDVARRLAVGVNHRHVVVDVGTGSGALAVAIARASSAATVIATDTSVGALGTARRNIDALARGRVELVHTDLIAGIGIRPDLIVANLPYIPEAELADLEPELAFEPRKALDGGPDGLGAIRGLLGQCRAVLDGPTELWLECGHDQGPLVATLARHFWPAASIGTHADLAGVYRFVQICIGIT